MYIYIELLYIELSMKKLRKRKSVFSEGEDRNKSSIVHHNQTHTVCTNC